MKPGQIIKTFTSKSGKEIVLRYPSMDDVQILLDYINEISREDTYITMSGEQETLESETKWVTDVLDKIEKKNMVHIMALCNEELVGTTQIDRNLEGKKRTFHVGTFGLSVKNAYRNDGIGYVLMQTVLEEAKKNLDLRIVTLTVFGNNPIAQGVYKAHGFKEFGKLPEGVLYKDEYVDYMYMYKKLS